MERKKAIVTGASRGIGAGIATCLAADGYDLAITYYHSKDDADKLAEKLKKEYGATCYVYQASVENKGVIENIIKDAAEKLGGLDFICNNAVALHMGGELLDITDEMLDHMLQANIRAVVVAMRTAARIMVKNGTRGSIVNTTSIRGERAFPGAGLYCGFKAGVNHLSRTFALDVAQYGIRINCVEPGYTKVRTDDEMRASGTSEEEMKEWDREAKKVPLGRAGTPTDIGQMVAFLASEKASYITGACIPVDGGILLPGMPTEVGIGTDVITRGWGVYKKRTTFDW